MSDSSPVSRPDGRRPGEARPFALTTGFTHQPDGSVLVCSGETRVICTASVEEKVPPFLRNTGKGWVTAEYGMLPAATNTRTTREVTAGKAGGRTMEIQRLIGRALRSVVTLEQLGERTIWIDCDVIQADGGTRTASITGAFVALVLALRKIHARSPFGEPPVSRFLAATSVGLVNGRAVLDLNYQEDRAASVDLNVVMTEDLELIEIQGTAEEQPFSRAQLDAMLTLAESGIGSHVAVQREALGGRLL